MARSTVTSKYQTTIPREVRDRLGMTASSELRCEVRDGCAVVTVAQPAFLARGATISSGPNPVEAVRTMRRQRGEQCCVATFDAKLRRVLKRLDIPAWSWS